MDEPPMMTSVVERRRDLLPELQLQRLLDMGAWLSFATWTIFAVLSWSTGDHRTGEIMFGVGIVGATSMLSGRRFGTDIGGTHLIVSLLGGLATVSATRGGVDPAVVQWFAVAPLAAMLGGRPRKALLWGALAVVSIIGLAIAQHSDVLPAVVPPSRYGGAASTVALVATILTMGVCFCRHREAAAARETALQHELFEAQRLDGLGRLAGAIAHDFNNLLSVIGTHGELAASEVSTDQERADDLEAVAAATRRGRQLTSELLGFASTADAGSNESLHPGEVVQQVARLLERVLPKNIRLTVALGRNVPSVLTSHRRLHQVLMNLCLNAKEAMPEGGELRLAVELFRGTPKGIAADRRNTRFARISVVDDGVGMTDRTRARVLDPLFTTKTQATGLGLTAVQRIVADSGGLLDISSTPATGSRFDVYLPALPEAEDAPALVHH